MSYTGSTHLPFRAEWSLTRRGETLELDVALIASVDFFVCDRTWLRGPSRERIPDPKVVYRFVVDDALVLLMGPSPPPEVEMIEHYKPLFSEVKAGATHRIRATIDLPVVEYSAFARATEDPFEGATAHRAVLLIDYAVSSELASPPVSPLGEPDAGFVVYGTKRASFERKTDAIGVRRRTRAIPRPKVSP